MAVWDLTMYKHETEAHCPVVGEMAVTGTPARLRVAPDFTATTPSAQS